MTDIDTRLRADADAWRQQARAGYPELDALLPRTQPRPHRRVTRTVAVASAAIAVAATAIAVALSRDGGAHAPAASNTSAAVANPIAIDSELTFQPLPAVPAGALTADEALAAYTAHHRHVVKHVPPGVRARFGVLSRPSSTRTWQVWAYSDGPLNCMTTGLVRPSPWPQCVEWDFLDAFTGDFVNFRQQILPTRQP